MCNIDWSQFIPTMIATFVGFLLAQMGMRLYNRAKNRSARRDLISSFISELELIRNKLIAMSDAKFENMMIHPIKMSVWESSINSNKLILLQSYAWYKDLYLCYSGLKDYNEWHNIRTKLVLWHSDEEKFAAGIEELTINLKNRGIEQKREVGVKPNLCGTVADLLTQLKGEKIMKIMKRGCEYNG